MFEITNKVMDSAQQLTSAVIQVAEMLGTCHAELARLLYLNCGDVGRLANTRQLLESVTVVWRQAVSLIRRYQNLYRN